MNINTSMNTIFSYLWEINKNFLFSLNEYICEYDYEYFWFRIHSHSAFSKNLKLFVSFWYL